MRPRIAINGFGRIGRHIARFLLARPEIGHLVCVNTLENRQTAEFLFCHDSTNPNIARDFRENGSLDNVRFLSEPSPGDGLWKDHNIDFLIECTGTCLTRAKTLNHLKAGAKRVLVTAAAEADCILCYGVNHQAFRPESHLIISASSCTTNCLAPVAKVLLDNFGIHQGIATFLHSYTSSQALLDRGGPDLRRMRSAPANLIPTETSASEQIPQILPALKGRFEASAIRVPTPVVHLANFVVHFARDVSNSELFSVLGDAANGPMKGILTVVQEQQVSIDFKGVTLSSCVDFHASKSYTDLARIVLWHDNEFSYAARIVDLLLYLIQQR